MIYDAREFTLRDGTGVTLAAACPDDAGQMLALLRTVCGETDWLLRYPDEWTDKTEVEAAFLQGKLDDPLSLMLTARVDGRLVADAGIGPVCSCEKTRHRAEIGISVLREFWGRGIGSLLMDECERRAKEAGYEQMELGVYADNVRAHSLYLRRGYEDIGHTRNAFKLRDGSYRDDITMGKAL